MNRSNQQTDSLGGFKITDFRISENEEQSVISRQKAESRGQEAGDSLGHSRLQISEPGTGKQQIVNSVQVICWDRGRPARNEREARKWIDEKRVPKPRA